MKFAEAFKHMKAGNPVKLPSWGGYWVWDEEKQTIMMHCREKDSDTGKDVLDIRETQRVEYTLSNILSDDWILATEENTPIMGGVATFGFGDAIKYLKRGMKVARKGWNGKGMFLYLEGGTVLHLDAVDEGTACQIRGFFKDKGMDEFEICSHINMKSADNKIVIGWLASQSDMLAEDWVFAE